MTGFDIVTETDTGSVYSSSSVAVYVHNDTVDDVEDAARNAKLVSAETPTGTARLPSVKDDDPRSPSERAELLALLIDRVGHFEFSLSDVPKQSLHSARIPVTVARDGTAAIACYLAIHGLDNSEIADLLDVGNRTVSQYLSDFRKGDR